MQSIWIRHLSSNLSGTDISLQIYLDPTSLFKSIWIRHLSSNLSGSDISLQIYLDPTSPFKPIWIRHLSSNLSGSDISLQIYLDPTSLFKSIWSRIFVLKNRSVQAQNHSHLPDLAPCNFFPFLNGKVISYCLYLAFL